MENENEEIETEVEGADPDAAAGLDTQDADATGGEAGTDTEGADSGASGDADAGPKSLAEALSAGIDSVAKKGETAAGDAKDGKDGADKEGTEKKDAAGGKDEKGADKGEKPPGKDGQPDHVNDPIDARLAPRTQERIRSLADEVKTLREVSTNNGAMIGAIMETGATPQEFGAMVGYLGAVHSDDPARLEAAYQLLQSELQGLALRMGKAIPEVDWLNGHQDLIDALRGGTTTRELAIEIAMNRASTKRAKAVAAEKAKQTETTQTDEKDAKAATAELDALGAELHAADPLYKAKFDLIVPKLNKEFAKLPPKQWKTRFLEEYARAKVGAPKAAPAAAAVPVNKPKGQPLRPSTPSGSTAKAPGSALDALSSAIDGMRN